MSTSKKKNPIKAPEAKAKKVSEPKMEWKQDMPSPFEIISALTEENQLLQMKLRQYVDKIPELSIKKPAQEQKPESYLGSLISGYEYQVRRLSENVNNLFAVSDRIQISKEDGVAGSEPNTQDLTSKLLRANEYFSYQNERFEQLLTKLQNLV